MTHPDLEYTTSVNFTDGVTILDNVQAFFELRRSSGYFYAPNEVASAMVRYVKIGDLELSRYQLMQAFGEQAVADVEDEIADERRGAGA